MKEGLAFDDVLIIPVKSNVRSRKDVSLTTRISKNISLNIPIISSNMDTVTEDRMAIEMARCGGIGIIHRYCSIDEQVSIVKKVKRAEAYIIADPYVIEKDAPISLLKQQMLKLNVKSFLVVDDKKVLQGVVTNRDIKVMGSDGCVSSVASLMTPVKNLYLGYPGIGIEEAKSIMREKRVQRLPIVERDLTVKGLICLKDIEHIENRPSATLDKYGQLRCGAAIGVKDDYLNRARALVDAGVDLLVIDIAHGHSIMCIETLQELKRIYPNIDVIAGNIATAEAAQDLIDAGADAVKVNIGAGSICTTRLVSGCGVPQLTALLDIAKICKKHDIPMISDGGNRTIGNIVKALAAGASTVMLGRMLAGTDESPGSVMIRDNKRVKRIRGMASYDANLSNAKRQGLDEPDSISSHVEGVDGYVPYTGPVKDTLNQIINGIRSGMGYCGAFTIVELQANAKFIKITSNGKIESGVHDIITH